jgi:hypothetical protein
MNDLWVIGQSSLDEMWIAWLKLNSTSGVGLGGGVGDLRGLRVLDWAGERYGFLARNIWITSMVMRPSRGR